LQTGTFQARRAVLLAILLGSLCTSGSSVPADGLSSASVPAKGPLLFSEDFDGDLSRWVVEQGGGGTTRILDSHLDIDDGAGPKDKGGCTVWFREKLYAPILIEYEATMVQNGGANDRVSDLNCFWMATDPEHPGDFFAASGERGGNFKKYDSLNLYYVGYGANGNITTRFRRYPRDREDRPLAPQYDLSEARFMNVPNRKVLLTLVADGPVVRFFRDGELVFDFRDEKPYREGWFGFRTVRNHLRIDRFRVYSLDPSKKT